MGEELTGGEFDQELIVEQLLADQGITQFSTRSLRDGVDTLCCYQRCVCSCTGDQTRLILHFPFYPPFQQIPEVQLNLLNSDLGRLRITDRQKFGARVEVSLGTDSAGQFGPSGLWIECLAYAPWSDDWENQSNGLTKFRTAET
jgi:hypothetical protein